MDEGSSKEKDSTTIEGLLYRQPNIGIKVGHSHLQCRNTVRGLMMPQKHCQCEMLRSRLRANDKIV